MPRHDQPFLPGSTGEGKLRGGIPGRVGGGQGHGPRGSEAAEPGELPGTRGVDGEWLRVGGKQVMILPFTVGTSQMPFS